MTRPQLGDIGAALGLLTRLPVPRGLLPQGDAIRHGAWAWPLVGAGLGAVTGLVLAAGIALGLPAGVAAGLALAVLLLLTGALHEDGLADTADGLGGGRGRERILAIMRDSRIGTYGVAALTLALVTRWSAMSGLPSVSPVMALAVVGAVSRLPMVLVMAAMSPARSDGASAAVGRPGRQDCAIAGAIAVAMSLAGFGPGGLLLPAVALIAILPLVFWTSRALGGQTGDILGASQQVAEIACLCTLLALD